MGARLAPGKYVPHVSRGGDVYPAHAAKIIENKIAANLFIRFQLFNNE